MIVALVVVILVVVALALVIYGGLFTAGPRRVWHALTGHPAEARWEGDYTAGCSVGPRACGAVWDGEDPR